VNEKRQTRATRWSATPLARILGPMQEFIHQSQSGGIVLLVGASWLAVGAGIAELPQGVNLRHMLGTSVLARMGFTMSLFISLLAFADPGTRATAKLAILLASLLAGDEQSLKTVSGDILLDTLCSR
jgi:Na+/H+ antiporter NhaA